MAKLQAYAYDPFPYALETEEWATGWKVEQAALEALMETSRNLADGEVVGAVLQWQRGDGYAFYIVVQDKPLTLAYLPVGDCWQVETALIRGLTKQDVLAMIEYDRRISSLFGESKEKMRE